LLNINLRKISYNIIIYKVRVKEILKDIKKNKAKTLIKINNNIYLINKKNYLYKMLTTNLLILLACKQYLVELNILNNFILKSVSVVIDINVVSDKLHFLVFRIAIATIY